MQQQHSCRTLASRIEIFGCMVQELKITFFPLDHYPLLHPACVHIKGVGRFLNSVETKAIPAHISKLKFLAVSRRDVFFQSGLTNQFCFAYISRKNEGDNKQKVDS